MRTGSFVYHNRPRWWVLVVAVGAAFILGGASGMMALKAAEAERCVAEISSREALVPQPLAVDAVLRHPNSL